MLGSRRGVGHPPPQLPRSRGCPASGRPRLV